MVGRVQLSFDQRQGLYALQQIERLSARADRRLVTRERLHSPADGVSDYFIAEQLGETTSILKARRREIEQGVSALTATTKGIESVRRFLDSAKAIAADALVTLRVDKTTRDDDLQQKTQLFLTTFNNLILTAQNTEYSGLNLITSTEQRLLVRYSDDRDQLLRVPGRSLFTTTTAFETGGIFSTNGIQGRTQMSFSLTEKQACVFQLYQPASLSRPEQLGGAARFFVQRLFLSSAVRGVGRASRRLHRCDHGEHRAGEPEVGGA